MALQKLNLMRTANDMNDEPYKGLAGLLGVLSPEQEKIEQAKARKEVGRKLGVTIPDPDEISASESINDSSDYLFRTPPVTFTEEVRDQFGNTPTQKREMINKQITKKPTNRFLSNLINEESAKKLSKQEKKRINFELNKASNQNANPKKEYKYPVKKYDSMDPSTYPTDPQQRMALMHGTATDQINEHHKDNKGKLLSKEAARKTLQYVSDSASKWDNAPKQKWLFNPVTGELEDTNDPQWIEKSEKKMDQFHATKVDPKTGQAEPKIGTDAHKEKYPERYKTGYVSKEDRIVSQLNDLKKFGKNKLTNDD